MLVDGLRLAGSKAEGKVPASRVAQTSASQIPTPSVPYVCNGGESNAPHRRLPYAHVPGGSPREIEARDATRRASSNATRPRSRSRRTACRRRKVRSMSFRACIIPCRAALSRIACPSGLSDMQGRRLPLPPDV
jgi:hypothetical protein